MISQIGAIKRFVTPKGEPTLWSPFRCAIQFVFFITLVASPFAQNGPSQDEAFRMELLDFFSNLETNSPTVFGKLAENPEALSSIRERVLDLNSEELSSMRERFAQAPYWQVAPEMLFSTLSPDLRSAISSSAAAVAGDPVESENFRGELASLNLMLELASPDELKELGIDGELMIAFTQAIEDSSPQQISVLRQKLTNDSGWATISSLLDSSLDPESKEAIQATIAARNLSSANLDELEGFREDFVSFLAGLQLLPEEELRGLDQNALYGTIQKIQDMSPEMLYLMRTKVEQDPALSTISESLKRELSPEHHKALKVLTILGPIDDGVKAELSEFRNDMDQFYSQIRESSVGQDSFPEEVHGQLQSLNPAQTALLRNRMEAIPGWRSVPTLNTAMQLVQSQPPEQFVEALQNTDPLELELVRADLIGALSSLDSSSSQQEAVQRLEELSPSQLVVTKQLLDLSPNVGRTDMAILLASSLAGTEVQNPGGEVQNLLAGCNLFSGYAINFDVCKTLTDQCDICPGISCPLGFNVPIPNLACLGQEFDAIASILDTITTQLPQVLTGVTNIAAQVPGIVDQVGSIVNQLPGIVGQISNLATDVVSKFSNLNNVISTFFSAVPQTVWNALSGLVNGILAGSGLPLNAQSLIDFLQLNNLGNLIASLPPLPDLPCPAEGTPLASFGDVGELETHLKYQQYQFVYETLGEIIPDNEYTAALEIPIQLVSASVGYIGQCLEAAAERADNAEQEEFMEEVAARFDSLDEYLAERFDLLDLNLDAKHLELTTQLTNAESNLSTQITDVANNLTDSVNTTQVFLDNSITTATTTLTTSLTGGFDAQDAFLEEFKYLMVRLKIERDLLETPKEGISLFLLPETMGGYLDTVRDIVQETIQSWDQIGEDMKSAFKEFVKGDNDYAIGSYKTAFDHYRKAYEQAVKK